MSGKAALIWCPFADEASARAVAERLLEEKLIACANILPKVTSIYRWKGATAQDNEVGVLFKTTANMLPRATDRIVELHPYETPAVFGWHMDAAPEANREWLRDCLGSGDSG